MHACSRPVISNQRGPHPGLAALVRSQLDTGMRRPVADYNRSVFTRLAEEVAHHGGPLVLDAGCGTGESTGLLAERHSRALVIGIDRSARVGTVLPEGDVVHRRGNAVWARADLVDIWRLAAAAGWRAQAQYFLYPNPWPKKRHLKRRWHAHPILADMLALGGRLEVRSNWATYIDELAMAMAIALGRPGATECIEARPALTPFERKYRDSGHALYRWVGTLDDDRAHAPFP